MTDVSDAPGRSDRPHLAWWVLAVIACIAVPAVCFAAAWSVHKKPWLMDDFRSGYAEGTQVLGRIPDPDRAGERCAELMASRYGGPPEYEQYETDEPASAFWWGCAAAVGGGTNDWWNVAGYLTA